MSDTAAGNTPPGSTSTPPAARRRGPVLAALLPAATFLVGLLLGFAIWGASGGAQDDEAGAVPTVTATGDEPLGSDAGGQDPDDRTVTTTVPEECLAAVAESERALGLVEEAVAAAGELDAARLQAIVDDLQASSTRAGALGEDCRAQADVSVGTAGSAPPA